MSLLSVYKHTAPSGRVYIGISQNPIRRWCGGNGYKNNPYFWRCIKKYGWENIKHEILYEGLSSHEAKAKEIELIAKYRSNERRYGYNIREGGDGSFSEESKKKMSISRLGNKNSVGRKLDAGTKEKISNSLKNYYLIHQPTFSGKHHTEETIAKLRNRVLSEETKNKMRGPRVSSKGAKNSSSRAVSCYTTDGVFIKTYAYATLATKEMGVDLSSIIKCCRGKNKTCKGLVWRYANQ